MTVNAGEEIRVYVRVSGPSVEAFDGLAQLDEWTLQGLLGGTAAK